MSDYLYSSLFTLLGAMVLGLVLCHSLETNPKRVIIQDTVFPVIRNINDSTIQIVTWDNSLLTIPISMADSVLYD